MNLRAALLGLDSSLEESAYSLGYSRFATFRFVMLPHLLPALLAGYMVVALYVLGDFGAVALMRYEAFSFAIFNQYSGAFDRIYAAWLSLMLLALAGSFLLIEYSLLKRKRLSSVGSGVTRHAKPFALGAWTPAAWLYVTVVFSASIGLPLTMLGYWMIVIPPDISLLMQSPFHFCTLCLCRRTRRVISGFDGAAAVLFSDSLSIAVNTHHGTQCLHWLCTASFNPRFSHGVFCSA
ncbi:ABC transporter permease subunit [Vibrio metschnikovii]